MIGGTWALKQMEGSLGVGILNKSRNIRAQRYCD